MDIEEIRYRVAGRVAALTLNRPGKLNAFTPRSDMPAFYPWREERPFK